MTLTKLWNLPWQLSQQQRDWLKKLTNDRRPEVASTAKELYEDRFPRAARNERNKQLHIRQIQEAYNSKEFYYNDQELKNVVDYLLRDDLLSDRGSFMFLDIYNSLVNPQDGSRGDPYYVLYDFRSYVGAQKRIDRDYRDRLGWARKCLMNLSMSGYFSSDRTVEEYAREIWKISPYFPLSEF